MALMVGNATPSLMTTASRPLRCDRHVEIREADVVHGQVGRLPLRQCEARVGATKSSPFHLLGPHNNLLHKANFPPST